MINNRKTLLGSFFRAPDKGTVSIEELSKVVKTIEVKTKNNPNTNVIFGGAAMYLIYIRKLAIHYTCTCVRTENYMNTARSASQSEAVKTNNILDLYHTNKPERTKKSRQYQKSLTTKSLHK